MHMRCNLRGIYLQCRILVGYFAFLQLVMQNLCVCVSPPGKLEEVYSKLVDANPNMVVYKKEDIPTHLHYQHNARIMPIIVEAKEGWTVLQNRTGSFMCTFSNCLFWDNTLVCSFTHETAFVVVSALLIAAQEILFSVTESQLAHVIAAVINREKENLFSLRNSRNVRVGVDVLLVLPAGVIFLNPFQIKQVRWRERENLMQPRITAAPFTA